MVSDITTIKVKKITRDKLASRGRKGDSFEDIISRMIKSKRRFI